MKILLDTQIFLWMFLKPSRISVNVESLLKNPLNEIFLSSASSWEITIKYGIGKLILPDAPEIYVPSRIKKANLKSLAISHEHTLEINNLPKIHKDPFDRIIIAQSNIEKLTILSSDHIFSQYTVKLIDANTY